MQIIVKTLTQSKHHLTFEASDSVLRIKQALQEKEGERGRLPLACGEAMAAFTRP